MSDPLNPPQAAQEPPTLNGSSPFPAPEPEPEITAEEAADILEQLQEPEEPISPPHRAPDPEPTPRDITLALRELESMEMRLTAMQVQLALVAGLMLLTVAAAALYRSKAA